MSLANRTHISWWPQDVGQTGKIYDAPAYPNQTLRWDTIFERRPPDVVIHLDNLDEDAIASWWNVYMQNNTWSTLTRNCSTTVGSALNAGSGFLRAPDFPWPIVWTPQDVENFARAIQASGPRR